MNLEKALEEYGVKNNHAKIYLACLELGSSPILKIAQKSGFARSTCEAVLNSLQKQGFVSFFKKKGVKYHSAEDPHKIISLAKEKAASLERVLPQLLARYGESKVNPTVRVFQGKTGMKLILGEILNEAKDIISFSSVDDLFSTLEEFAEFVKKRVAKKIPVKVILRDSPKARERQKLGPQELRQVKIIPSSYEYHGMIFVWAHKVAMFSFTNDLTVLVIESEELAKVQRAMFDLIWNTETNRI